MPLLRKGILIPCEGVDFSAPAMFINDRAGFPQNMRFFRNEIRKRPGKTLLGGVASDSTQIMGFGKLELSTGSKFLVRASKAALEKYNTSTLVWDSIASTAFTGGDEDFFSFATVTEDDILIITNGFDKPRKWVGSGNNAVLGGSPPYAKYCTYLSPYVLLAWLTEAGDYKPWKVAWCDTNAPETWSGGNSGSALLSAEPSPIQNIIKLNEFVAAYKKESLYLGRKVETSDVFIFDTVKTGIGLASPRAVAEAEGQHFFMGANDFYVWNGIREQSIGRALRDEVFSRIDRNKINRCFAVHVQELTEIWFFVVISGNSWPTEIWKYNYRNGFWYYDTCSSLTSAIKWEAVTTETWDDDSGAWDAAGDVWDSGLSVAKWEDIVFGDSGGYSYSLDYTTTNDNSVAVSAHFISKDFTGDQLEFMKRWLKLDLWGKGPGKLYIDYSTDEGSNWINIPYSSSQAYIDLGGTIIKYEMYFDIVAEKIRFRFRNAESDETFYLRNFYPYYLSREPIVTRR